MNKLVYIFTLFTICVNAQKLNLTVEVNELADNTKLYFDPSFLEEYYELPIHDSIQYSVGENTLQLEKMSFYYPFQLSFKEEENIFQPSRRFYLKDHDVNISIQNIISDITTDIPERTEYNKFFNDYLKEERAYNEYHGNMYLKYKFDYPKEVQDSMNKWYSRNWKQEINLLDQYIKLNSKSVIAFWKIVEKYERYKEYPYDSLLTQFDSIIKESFPYKKLMNNIENNKIFGQGKTFPEINNLKDQFGNSTQLNFEGKKYILIDFWFHACKPCLVTFPHLKEVYQKYHSKGFDIIAISTDGTKYIQNWKNTIKKNELPWVNLLDENGCFSSKNKINSFPTNYLVDEQGKILAKDISTEQLDEFLNRNLPNE
ncbi:TlpA family protein disulfide reductase [Empedobacter falsenii]|uniref:TlpA family protein disulfide reductase n=1 Tax=Empedobacter stercoris TaxID=1628248 RepID=UPI0016622980|nr:TlpA disulfide reductase family protein [Empedobacter stercoris]MCA4810681.1 TlpA family protein disulfide reductase [Empedobacter stercoris]QNT14919.1 TlpA family protein disulfide reductase [Empedobacter stercoris]